MNHGLARLARWRHTGVGAVLYIAATLGPLLLALVLSFATLNPERKWELGTLGPYRDALSPRRIAEYGRVIVRAAVVASACQLIAMPIAYFLTRARSARLRATVLLLLAAPFFASDALRAFGWQVLLAPDGWIGEAWGLLALGGAAEGLRYTYWAPAIALGASVLPLGVITACWSLPPASSSVWLASDDFGGGPAQVFVHIALPLAAPGAAMGWCAMFVLAAFSSAEVRFLEGPTQTSLQSIAASLLNSNVPAVFALASLCVLFAMCGICAVGLAVRYAGALRRGVARAGSIIEYARAAARKLLWGLRLPVLSPWAHWSSALRAASPDDSDEKPLVLPERRSQGLRRVWLDAALRGTAAALTAAAVIYVLLPVVAVADLALTRTSAGGSSRTVVHFQTVFHSDRLAEATFNSLTVAVVVGLVSGATAIVLGTLWWRPRLRAVAMAAASFGFVLPPEAYALSLQQLGRLVGLETGSLWLVMLAHTVWTAGLCLGFSFLVNSRLDIHMLESALEMGAGPARVLIGIVLRITWRAIVAGGVTAAMFSLNEYPRAAYLAGRDRMISTEVYGHLTSGLVGGDRSIYAASTLMFLASLFALLITSGAIRVTGARLRDD
jgi:spermidine/putrescine transport system permease protein